MKITLGKFVRTKPIFSRIKKYTQFGNTQNICAQMFVYLFLLKDCLIVLESIEWRKIAQLNSIETHGFACNLAQPNG